jgi:hypothetical protein
MAVREETALENDVSYDGSFGRASFTRPIQPLNAPKTVSLKRSITAKNARLDIFILHMTLASGERSHKEKKPNLSLLFHIYIAAFFFLLLMSYIHIH